MNSFKTTKTLVPGEVAKGGDGQKGVRRHQLNGGKGEGVVRSHPGHHFGLHRIS